MADSAGHRPPGAGSARATGPESALSRTSGAIRRRRRARGTRVPDGPARTTLNPVPPTNSWSDDELADHDLGDHPPALRRGVPRAPAARPGRRPRAGGPPRRVRRTGPHRPRPPHVRLAGHRAQPGPAAVQDRRVPVRRVPDGPPAGQRPAGHRADRRRPRGPGRPGARPRRHLRHGGRARPGQRRPRPARRMLRRLAGHPRPPGHRVRDPLRVRHLRAVLRGRSPGREARPVARPRQPVALRPARARRVRRVRRARGGGSGDGRPDLVPRGEGARRPAQPDGPRLRQQRGQHAAPVEGARLLAVQPRGVQRRRLHRGRAPAVDEREHLARALPGGLHARRARSCACASSTSSPRARWPTSSAWPTSRASR